MGIASYNRSSSRIRESIDADCRPVEFEIMERLNALPKYADAGKPFGQIQFESANGGFWAVCPKSGFGFFYRTLPEAVKRWAVEITSFDNGKWIAGPIGRKGE